MHAQQNRYAAILIGSIVGRVRPSVYLQSVSLYALSPMEKNPESTRDLDRHQFFFSFSVGHVQPLQKFTNIFSQTFE